MIADTCRDFGQSPDYWEDALTMQRLIAQQKSLTARPPADWFMSVYFRSNYGWKPESDKATDPPQQVMQGVSDLPEYEE